jgi:Family of unknown function (DUF6065)
LLFADLDNSLLRSQWLAARTMKLECYALWPEPPMLAPARPTRAWMDATRERYAYRCLPLNIANGYGWEILCPCSFSIQWNGGEEARDIQFAALDGYPHLSHFVVSHFSHGVVTFHTGYLFKTEPGWELLVTGPMNEPKDGIAALAGVIETDWLPFPFTMNWRLTRRGEVRFEKGEPFCLIVPQQRGMLAMTQPEVLDINAYPEVVKEYETWKSSRAEFLAKLNANDEETVKQAWQRFYFKGQAPPGSDSKNPDHTSKLRLAVPLDKRKGRGGG